MTLRHLAVIVTILVVVSGTGVAVTPLPAPPSAGSSVGSGVAPGAAPAKSSGAPSTAATNSDVGDGTAAIQSAPSVETASPAGGNWTSFGHDPARTGSTDAVGLIRTPTVKWRHGTGFPTRPVAADVDGDGSSEVVVGGRGGDNSVVALNGTTATDVAWQVTSDHELGEGSPAIGDLNGDGSPDVVVGNERQLLALDGTDGSTLWRKEKGFDWDFRSSSPTVADIDDDGTNEVVVSLFTPPTGSTLLAIDGATGETEWSHSDNNPAYDPAVDDLDDDPAEEVVFATSGPINPNDNTPRGIWAVDGDSGRIQWRFRLRDRFKSGAAVSGTPALGDVDADGTTEVVFTVAYSVVALDGTTGSLEWNTTKPLEGTEEETFSRRASPSLADLDGDGGIDVVVGDRESLFALDGVTGNMIWAVPEARTSIGEFGFEKPAVGDVDADGSAEVVLSNRQTDRVVAVDGATGRAEWNVSVGSDLVHSPVLADIDDDGLVEVVVGHGRGVLAIEGKREPAVGGGNLSIVQTTPGVVRSKEFTFRAIGSGLAGASVELVSPSGERVAPRTADTGTGSLRAAFRLPERETGIWKAVIRGANGKRVTEPVFVQPDAPMSTARTSWPFTVVPGRTTEMRATVQNFGSTRGVAIFTVTVPEYMRVDRAVPGADGQVLSSKRGRIVFAQPVSGNGDTARLRVQFHLSPQYVAFQGMETNGTRFITSHDRVVFGNTRLLGTLTPAQWRKVRGKSPEVIERRAVFESAERFRRIQRAIKRDISDRVLRGNSSALQDFFSLYISRASQSIIRDRIYRNAPNETESRIGRSEVPPPVSSRLSTSYAAGSDPIPDKGSGVLFTDLRRSRVERKDRYLIRTKVTLVKVDIARDETSQDAWFDEDEFDLPDAEPGLNHCAWQVQDTKQRGRQADIQDQGCDFESAGGDTPNPDIEKSEIGDPWKISKVIYEDTECAPMDPVLVSVTLREKDEETWQEIYVKAGLTVVSLGTALVITGPVGLAVVSVAAAGAAFAWSIGEALNGNDLYGVYTRTFKRPTPGPTVMAADTKKPSAYVSVDVDKKKLRRDPTCGSKDEDGGDGGDGDETTPRQRSKHRDGERGEVETPKDPNDIVARPPGVGDARYVTSDQQFTYRVRFENLANASAAAKDVTVTVPIHPALRFESVEVTGSSHPDVMVVSRDRSSRTLTVQFPRIFLPPNENPPEGEGWVEFTARPRANLSSGTTITENASIRFEANPPIETNEVTHTLDSASPTTEIGDLASVQPTEFRIPWNGSDRGGAGIEEAVLWVASGANNRSFRIAATTNNSSAFRFQGEPGETYRFSVMGIDRVGRGEVVDPNESVTVRINTPPNASLAVDPTEPTAGESVQFTANATDEVGNVSEYEWEFGDGGTATGPEPSHTFDDPGTYNVTLRVTDEHGATDTASMQIRVGGGGSGLGGGAGLGGLPVLPVALIVVLLALAGVALYLRREGNL